MQDMSVFSCSQNVLLLVYFVLEGSRNLGPSAQKLLYALSSCGVVSLGGPELRRTGELPS